MAFQEKQLGQVNPAAATDTQLYSPAASTTAIVKTIIVTETGGAAATFRIYNDDNGTTRDATTALYYDVSLTANETQVISLFLALDDSSGEIAVRASTADVTFTAHGAEIT